MTDKLNLYNEAELKIDNMIFKLMMDDAFDRVKGYIKIMHSHKYSEIFYVESGTMDIVFGDETVTLVQDDLIIVTPNVFHYSHSNDEELKRYTFSFAMNHKSSSELSSEFDTMLYEKKYIIVKGDKRILEIFRHIRSYYKEDNVEKRHLISSCFYELIFLVKSKLNQNHMVLKTPEIILDNAYRYYVIDNYIYNHFMEDISLEYLANKVYLSTHQLNRIIKKNRGKTLHQYIISLRMQSAVKMLCETKLKIKDISYAIGYSSLNGFYTVFKKAYKITPETYRLKYSEIKNNITENGDKQMTDEIRKIVYEAGKIMLTAHDIKNGTSEKYGTANFVTAYDLAVQKFLYEKLELLLPEANFIGEESSNNNIELIKNGYSFIIDPIDGTTNFIHGYSHSSISVGLSKDGEIIEGVVYNPYLGEFFSAEKGKGAYLNGNKIEVSNRHLCDSLIAFGSSPYYRELADKSFDVLKTLYLSARDIRRSGSAALDMCYAACGRTDLFFELRLSPWDYAAGSIIVTEAGGIAMSMEQTPLTLDKPSSLLAGNPIAYNEVTNRNLI